VRERLRTLKELYDTFQKFNRSKVLHFRRLGQARKVVNEHKSLRPTKYIKGRVNTSSFDTTHKQVHSIDSDGCGEPKNWEKNFRPPQIESESRTYTPRREYHPRGGYPSRDRGRGEIKTDPCIACFMREIQTIIEETIPSS
jgi:hypothetical protein